MLQTSHHDHDNGVAADVVEITDAPENTTTPYEIGLGDSFQGTIDVLGDIDWVEVTFEAGVTYTISGTVGADKYLDFVIYDSDGNFVDNYLDDVASDTTSTYTFTATQSGTHYLSAEIYQDTGSYSVSYAVGNTPPPSGGTLEELTYQEIADYLTFGYWDEATSLPDNYTPFSFNVAPGGTITVNISALTDAGKQFASYGLAAWAEVTGLNFALSTSAGADIIFDDNQSGAFASSSFSSTPGEIEQSNVNVSTNWIAGDIVTDSNGNQIAQLNSYSTQTYIHEIGHALGLGHAGNYNGTGGYAEDGSGDNFYLNDSWQATVMSYFSQIENTHIDASFAYIGGPMMADILAIQALYGTSGNLNTGHDVYGTGGTMSPYYAALLAEGLSFVIYDEGGIDTVDLSIDLAQSDEAFAHVDMNDGTYSDFYFINGGLVEANIGTIGIAQGVDIENLIMGNYDDIAIGNALSNNIDMVAGDDSVNAGAGNDTVFGGSGSDTINGEEDDDLLYGNDGDDRLTGGSGNDVLNGGSGFDNLNGGSDDDILRGQGDGDTMIGGLGDDELYGGNGSDSMSGNAGNDTMLGQGLGDTLDGGGNDDLIYGGSGNDVLLGSGGNDTILGQGNNDTMDGGTGNDSLVGAAGLDQLFGDVGNDTLKGGGANDTLSGGDGDDLLVGGAGRDVFIFDDGGDTDRINGYQQGFDTIQIDDDLYAGNLSGQQIVDTFGSLNANGTILTLDFGNGTIIEIQAGGGIDDATLGNDIFVL
ncbi:Serralysin C precursor [Rhodobacteraceae bacterium THAF1]|uniref:M10 family metallopeptidase n=1 Tax=Palleronia sp. THAF1 TaxID=2587842 RepID=UPI000F3DE964|nr:M10 family metallopeptidase [Palleronia sp. THAF1]QFU10087.1 Serralysin C precursor [Palleronia sp. THAF1]VDC17008.1 Serralysin C precursor [Rhodobacteraceae bacterium THAF1]